MNQAGNKILNTVQPRGDVIRRDRLNQGYSQDALLERCRDQAAHFSIQSLRRAERGERVARATLEGIAKALGRDPGYYIVEGFKALRSTAPDILGEWHGMCVEDDRLSSPYVYEESLVFSRSEDGGLLVDSGALHFLRTEITKNVVQIDDMIMGQVMVEGWQAPHGVGTFQLQVLRENTFLEGYTTWYDLDSKRIEASKYVAVRRNVVDYDDCIAAARAIIEKETAIYTMRNK